MESSGSAVVSRETVQHDEKKTGPEPAGQKNEELEWARRNIPDDPATLLVERKTEILGWGVPARKRERELSAEVMVERVVLPAMEKMQNVLLKKIDALDARVSTLEASLPRRKKRKEPPAGEGGGAP